MSTFRTRSPGPHYKRSPSSSRWAPLRGPPASRRRKSPWGITPPGKAITGALEVQADALIILYTELETRALLDVFTQDSDWSPARRKTWNGYGHNFSKFKSTIEGISGDTALEDGLFGYLAAVTIGKKTVVLFKSELHPKQNGPQLPFVPVIQQLVGELRVPLVISTGTGGRPSAAR